MTLVTTPGSEIMARCGAFTSVMWACAFSAQDGMVFQAGTPDGWVRAIVGLRDLAWEDPEFVSAARAQIAEDLPKCLASGVLVRCGGCAGAGDDVA